MSDLFSAADAIRRIEADAYRRGYADCLAQFSRLVTNLAKRTSAANLDGAPISRATAKPIVLATIKARPGKRGIEIFDAIVLSGVNMQERSFRTALHRLKTEKLIKAENGGWWPMEPESLADARDGCAGVIAGATSPSNRGTHS